MYSRLATKNDLFSEGQSNLSGMHSAQTEVSDRHLAHFLAHGSAQYSPYLGTGVHVRAPPERVLFYSS